MDFEKRFCEISEFLKKHRDIWFSEILYDYPNWDKGYTNEIVQAFPTISLLSEEEIYQLEAKKNYHILQDGKLKELIKEIDSLTVIEKKEFIGEDYEPLLWQKIKGKKKHEIESIIPHLKNLNSQKKLKSIVDIGGGVGHLAKVCSYKIDCPAICLDMDEKLQEIGKKQISKRTKRPENEITFFPKKIESDKCLLPHFSKDSLVTGLHCCGALSSNIIKASVQSPIHSVLSFGCCYFKMTKKEDFNLSLYAKNQGLEISECALTLANRQSSDFNEKTFKTKQIVKNYRYTLHLLLYKNFGIRQFTSLGGNRSNRYHNWSFSDYAREQLEKMKLEVPPKEELEKFYEDNQNEVNKMTRANIIRNLFSRPIELYLLLDRAIFLQENHFKVEVKTWFDGAISPRNIGIFAYKL